MLASDSSALKQCNVTRMSAPLSCHHRDCGAVMMQLSEMHSGAAMRCGTAATGTSILQSACYT